MVMFFTVHYRPSMAGDTFTNMRRQRPRLPVKGDGSLSAYHLDCLCLEMAWRRNWRGIRFSEDARERLFKFDPCRNAYTRRTNKPRTWRLLRDHKKRKKTRSSRAFWSRPSINLRKHFTNQFNRDHRPSETNRNDPTRYKKSKEDKAIQRNEESCKTSKWRRPYLMKI